jgi:hypothetical protein
LEFNSTPGIVQTLMLLPPELGSVDLTVLELGPKLQVEFGLVHSSVVHGSLVPNWARQSCSQEDCADPALDPCLLLAQQGLQPQEDPYVADGYMGFRRTVASDGQLEPLQHDFVRSAGLCQQPPTFRLLYQADM